jgi:hypothetical protein
MYFLQKFDLQEHIEYSTTNIQDKEALINFLENDTKPNEIIFSMTLHSIYEIDRIKYYKDKSKFYSFEILKQNFSGYQDISISISLKSATEILKSWKDSHSSEFYSSLIYLIKHKTKFFLETILKKQQLIKEQEEQKKLEIEQEKQKKIDQIISYFFNINKK